MAINTNYYGDYYRRNDFATQNRFNNVSQQNNTNIFTNQTNVFKSSVSSACKDGKDDGSIGFWEATKNVLKGGVKFFTGMFTDENGDFSWKQTLKTVGMGALIGLATMIPVVGPLVLPALCTYGMLHGGKEVLSGISNAMNATTDAEAQAAWQEVGSGATEGVLSYTGYKATGGFKKAWSKTTADYAAIKAKFTSNPKPAASEPPASTPVSETPAPKPVEEAVKPVVEESVQSIIEESITPVVEEPVQAVVEKTVEPVVEESVSSGVKVEPKTSAIKKTVAPTETSMTKVTTSTPTNKITSRELIKRANERVKSGAVEMDLSLEGFDTRVVLEDCNSFVIKTNNVSKGTEGFAETFITNRKNGPYGSECTHLFLDRLEAGGNGAGTELIRQVVKLSDSFGLDGRVILDACEINPAKGTPIPFYHKMGFKAIDPSVQAEIISGMENLRTTGVYTGPRTGCEMYLPLDRIEALLNKK